MKKYSLEELAQVVESEGLGYAIQHYLDAERIEDPEMAALWKQCAELMDQIDKKLEPYKF